LKSEGQFTLITSAVQLVAFIVSTRYDLNGKKDENGVRTRKIQNEQCSRDETALNPSVPNGLDIRSPPFTSRIPFLIKICSYNEICRIAHCTSEICHNCKKSKF